jgi:hypothetical protein
LSVSRTVALKTQIPSGIRRGDTHKPHQVTGLFWSLYMEIRFGVFANADGYGGGKTHAYITNIEASTSYWGTTFTMAFAVRQSRIM